jgi:sugar phosphate isomerase/epimerase
MEFAACLWDLASEEEAIIELAACGIGAIELGAVFLTEHDVGAIEDVGRWCSSVEIERYACHAPFGGSSDLSLLDEDARLQAVAITQESVERAALVGAECAVIHPSAGYMPEGERSMRRQQLMRSLEALIPAAERIGVRLALENMLPHHIGDSATEVRQIIEYFGSKWLGVCFDTGHAHLNPGGVGDALEVLYDQIINFHLQDNDGNHDRHLQPPYGTIDWGAFGRRCEWSDFAFPLSVETLPWQGSGWDVMMREVRALFSVGLLSIPWGSDRVHVVCQRCGRYCFGTAESWFCGCTCGLDSREQGGTL